jgi:hypothetical protein
MSANSALHPTWGFMQVGLDNLRLTKLQSQASVPAGQSMLGISFNFVKIFLISSGSGRLSTNSQPA